MLATTPMSALELCDAIRSGKPFEAARLNRILGLDAVRGLLEVQAATPWHAIAAELRPGDERAKVRTTMATVGESLERNAAGPDGMPAVSHVSSLTVVTPDGELRRVSRERNRDLFALVVGGYGLFGPVYSITLRIATLARAVERATRPQELILQKCRANRTLELLIPPESLDRFVAETDTRCSDWRIPLQSVGIRQTAREEDSYLRWARRDFAEVKLALAEPVGLGAKVRGAQLRHELIDAAIEGGGSFHIACTADATREQTEACYPQLRSFLAQKRRFDPHERLVNAWYLRQREVLHGKPCEVRFAN
jgi:FAD/FMN-containing dehydrogenase